MIETMKPLFTFLVIVVSLVTEAFGQVKADPTSVPTPRSSDQMMTYDESQRRVLVFGGTGQNNSYGDLWAWDGRVWARLAASGPAPRNSGVLVYDTRRKRTVLFGGRTRQGNENILLKDTWEWDGARWHLVNEDGPAPRLHSAAAFDRRRGLVVLFGPVFAPTHMPRPLPTETWTWNGKQWAKIKATGPTDCLPIGMVFDEAKATVLLLVTKLGNEAKGTPWGATELWEWTGIGWRQNPMPVPAFAPNQSNVVAAGARDGVLVFEASNQEGLTGATWRWDGTRWMAINKNSAMAQRGGHVLAYDRARQRVVMFGGTILLDGGKQRQRINDLWEWDGKQWAMR
jgi:hypothetical protein